MRVQKRGERASESMGGWWRGEEGRGTVKISGVGGGWRGVCVRVCGGGEGGGSVSVCACVCGCVPTVARAHRERERERERERVSNMGEGEGRDERQDYVIVELSAQTTLRANSNVIHLPIHLNLLSDVQSFNTKMDKFCAI